MTLCGGLMLGQTGSTVLEGSLPSAREHDLPCEVLKPEDVLRRFPAVAPARGTVALYEAVAGLIDPTSAMNAQLERSASLGAELRFEEPVVSWEAADSGDGVRVETPAGVYEAKRLVLTSGAWSSEVTRGPGPPLEPERRVICWLKPEGDAEPFLPGNFPDLDLGAGRRQRVHLLPAGGGRAWSEDGVLPRRRPSVIPGHARQARAR